MPARTHGGGQRQRLSGHAEAANADRQTGPPLCAFPGDSGTALGYQIMNRLPVAIFSM